MKKIGILSCNINCNFTNYGSALQSWALTHVIDLLGDGRFKSVLIDYCPPSHEKYDPLNPMKNMWDKDIESLKECEFSLPAIRENYHKFENFYKKNFQLTKQSYTATNYATIRDQEMIDAFKHSLGDRKAFEDLVKGKIDKSEFESQGYKLMQLS